MDLDLGFRFRPTDFERLVLLLKFISKGDLVDCGFVKRLNVYGEKEPWEIYAQGVPCGGGDEDHSTSCNRFFISELKIKSESGKITRICREVGKGIWKQQDKGKDIHYYGGKIIGHKKSLSYVTKNSKDQKEEEQWRMKEYELSKVILGQFSKDCPKYVLCAIKKKPHNKTTASSNSETTSTTTETTTLNNNTTALASLALRDQEVTSTTNWESQCSDFQGSLVQYHQAIMESMVGETEGTGTQQYCVYSNTEPTADAQQLTLEEWEHKLYGQPHQAKPLSVVEPQAIYTSRDQQYAAVGATQGMLDFQLDLDRPREGFVGMLEDSS